MRLPTCLLLGPACLLLAAGPASADERDLFAGQSTLVGSVLVCDDGLDLTVTYDTVGSDWFMTDTHLFVGWTAPARPAPGQFPYKSGDLWTQEETWTVPLSDFGATLGDSLVLAAHANVEDSSTIVGYTDPTLELDPSIPGTVNIRSTFPGGDSYWNTTISNGGDLDGLYDGWCVDTGRTMAPGATYTANVYSSYDPAGTAFVDQGDNFDLVNWILNQDYAGQPSPGCAGSYTYGDVQRAIWTLIDDTLSTAGLGAWSQCRADEIIAAALLNGEGFEPGCFDSMAVIFVPVNAGGGVSAQVIIAQVIVADVDVACDPIYQGETAWASGDTAFKQGWGSWWEYEVGSMVCQ